MQVKKIFSKQLANYLCHKGFYIIDTEIHNKKPWLYVYKFEDSQQLRDAMEQFSAERGRRNV